MSDYEGTNTPAADRILRLICLKEAVSLCENAGDHDQISPTDVVAFAKTFHEFIAKDG